MTGVSILRAFGAALLLLAVLMIGPWAVAAQTGSAEASSYLYAGAATGIFGFSLVIMSQGKAGGSRIDDAMMIALCWWVGAPVFAGLPFFLSGYSLVDGYFEAVSALTTTGGWLSATDARASMSGMLWRAELQWIGGLSSMAIAAAIFIRPSFVGTDALLPPFSLEEGGSHVTSIRAAALAFLPAFGLLTAISIVALVAAGAPPFESLVLAMSTVASGGFSPRLEGLDTYDPQIAAVLTPVVFLSGANFILVARMTSGRVGRMRDIETGAYGLIFLALTLVLWVLVGAPGVQALGEQAFNAASLISTNGFFIGAPPPTVLGLVTLVIGGSAVSAAGGIKVLRWVILLRRTGEELRLLLTPRGVFGRSNVSDEFGVWMHFIGFTVVLAALLLAVAAGGNSFELAAIASVAALSNAGPALGLAGSGVEGFEVFDDPFTRLALAVGMVLGRLETVAALGLLNRIFWRA